MDLYQLNNRIYALAVAYEGKPATEFHAAVRRMLQEHGFPDCSDRLADRLCRKVREALEELKKKDGPVSKTPG